MFRGLAFGLGTLPPLEIVLYLQVVVPFPSVFPLRSPVHPVEEPQETDDVLVFVVPRLVVVVVLLVFLPGGRDETLHQSWFLLLPRLLLVLLLLVLVRLPVAHGAATTPGQVKRTFRVGLRVPHYYSGLVEEIELLYL